MPKTTSHADTVDLRQVKQTLISSLKTRNMTVAGLAKQLGTGRTSVRRALDVKNTATTFKTIQRTARVLGYRIKLEAQPLAPVELGDLAGKMVNAKTTQEGDRLQAELVKGFFGDAENPA